MTADWDLAFLGLFLALFAAVAAFASAFPQGDRRWWALVGLLALNTQAAFLLEAAGVAATVGAVWTNALRMVVLPLMVAYIVIAINSAPHPRAAQNKPKSNPIQKPQPSSLPRLTISSPLAILRNKANFNPAYTLPFQSGETRRQKLMRRRSSVCGKLEFGPGLNGVIGPGVCP